MKGVFLCELLIFFGFALGACQKKEAEPNTRIKQPATKEPGSFRPAPTTPGRIVAPGVLKAKMEPVGTPAPEPSNPAPEPPHEPD
jgi:hypothetical protein